MLCRNLPVAHYLHKHDILVCAHSLVVVVVVVLCVHAYPAWAFPFPCCCLAFCGDTDTWLDPQTVAEKVLSDKPGPSARLVEVTCGLLGKLCWLDQSSLYPCLDVAGEWSSLCIANLASSTLIANSISDHAHSALQTLLVKILFSSTDTPTLAELFR